MALLDEIEPPSKEKNGDTEKTKVNKLFEKIKNHLFNSKKSFLVLLSVAKNNIGNWFQFLTQKLSRNFLIVKIYLPHIFISVLVIIVAASNFNDKVLSKYYRDEYISLDPDIRYAITQTIDNYTPLIKDDAGSVDKVILASEVGSGFISNTSTVATTLSGRAQSISGEILPDNSINTIEYIVENSDTLTGLGWKFEVKIATLKYLNNLDDADLIKPGMKLKVPPKNYEVSATLIAKKEKERAVKLAAANRNTVTRNGLTSRAFASDKKVKYIPGSSKNGYPYGYCTYYVATRRGVPSSWGDAKRWLSSARSAGYQTGSTPAVGSIAVTSESFWGHVAYVESADGGTFTIAEMNARGWGVISRRTLSVNDGVVRGFIY